MKSIVIERTVAMAGKRVEDIELDAVARFTRASRSSTRRVPGG
jgi:hypothetical protein